MKVLCNVTNRYKFNQVPFFVVFIISFTFILINLTSSIPSNIHFQHTYLQNFVFS